MELADRRLKFVRASIGTTQATGLDMGVNAMQMFAHVFQDFFVIFVIEELVKRNHVEKL
jgi:hypothetical protein